jgi:crossover junction endodeoxyribonuclease RuvC
MLECNKPRISAAPPQSPQSFVCTVYARARASVTPITTNCGDCGGSQDSCGFPADGVVADPVLAPGVGHRPGGAARPAIEGRDDAGLPPNVGPGRAAALSLLEAGHAPTIDPLRLQQRAILALDLGQKTGWAVRNTEGAIASGTVEFKPGRFEGGGMVYLRFRAWLQEVDETAGGIATAYFEEVRFHAGVTAAHFHGGFLAHLTAWAEMNKIPYRGVPVGTIKRHVTGRGNASKEEVITGVRRLGFDPVDDNEADALALLDWALKTGGRR